MTDLQQQVDLSSCDREPIHQLGTIQNFGALIAVTADWLIAFRSTNCDTLLHSRRPIAIGDRLAAHFAEDALATCRTLAGYARETGLVERVFGIDLFGSGRSFDLALHVSGKHIVIEAEPHSGHGLAHHAGLLRPIMDRLGRKASVEELGNAAAVQLRRLLGFDRVMVYRFHPDLSGEVIAEARESHLEAFLGLRYPKTDIPEQARRLYLKNPFRIISDVNAEPVPIEPAATLDGEPLDLSLSGLRAVSRIHIEYLQNMGVGASLSISIIVGGKLWGLFACHHYSARQLPFAERTVAELFSQLFSAQLELVLMAEGSAMRDRVHKLHEDLMSQLIGGGSLSDNLRAIETAIGAVVPHDGLSIFLEDKYRSRGSAPSEEEFRTIIPALNTSSTSTIVHSVELPALIPQAARFAGRAVGAIIIPVSRRPRDFVVLWRRELPQVVKWAGNPDKAATLGPNGDRLTPRKSFAAWQQSVTGRSATWTQDEIGIAEGLRVTMLEVILRATDDQVQERARAQERQELLIAELNHRVRNILTLIRSLVKQSRADATDVREFADMIGGRVQALAMAHDHITRKNWSPAPLREMIEAEAEAYLSTKADRVQISGDDVLVAPEAYTVLALVVHELMTNSAKYGSLCDSNGVLQISTRLDQHNDLVIEWRERGGPPVKAPERRGFGSTIIEKSVPFELQGEAQVRYRLAGFEADFLIPSRYITRATGTRSSEKTITANPIAEVDRMNTVTDGRTGVLLVEDSMIIAMDAEEMLLQLGIKRVAVASTVTGAMTELAENPPAFALLDFNLGNETSEPVAARLTELEIPYWFVTGYGDAIEQLSQNTAAGVLQKPYSSDDLKRVLSHFGMAD